MQSNLCLIFKGFNSSFVLDDRIMMMLVLIMTTTAWTTTTTMMMSTMMMMMITTSDEDDDEDDDDDLDISCYIITHGHDCQRYPFSFVCVQILCCNLPSRCDVFLRVLSKMVTF